jgi:uncharacterized protein (DUF1499 family)
MEVISSMAETVSASSSGVDVMIDTTACMPVFNISHHKNVLFSPNLSNKQTIHDSEIHIKKTYRQATVLQTSTRPSTPDIGHIHSGRIQVLLKFVDKLQFWLKSNNNVQFT